MISDFGATDDGRRVRMVTLKSDSIACTALDLGCSLRSIEVPDRDGVMFDVLLGYDDADSYLHNSGHFGGVIGRYANRIRGGVCLIDGRLHQLSRNRNGNHMHGGYDAFDKRVWNIAHHDESSVVFELDDPDGTEGYPGSMHVSVRYSLSPGRLVATYTASSDEDTVCNIINHAYFNLGRSDTVEDHMVRIDADRFTPLDSDSIPTGAIEYVEGTPMDLRDEVRIGDRFTSTHPSIADANGFDCNLVMNGNGSSTAYSHDTGIRLTVRSNMPGMQFYTGNGIKPGTRGKNGSVYGRWSGLCFETQHFPNAPNEPGFPSAVLRKGETYIHETVYDFTAE